MSALFTAPTALLGTQISPGVTLHHLLTGWQTGTLSLVSFALEALAAGWYVAATRRLAARGRSWSRWRTASFLVGLAWVVVAIGSGVAYYDDSVFVMHAVQHLILMNAAPVFLALGAPVTLALQSSSRRTQRGLLKVLHNKLFEALTHPVVVASLAYLTMLVYFLTPLYAISERHPLVHDYMHLQFLVAGCLYWWPVVGLDPSRWRMSYPVRLGYLATGVPVNAILGVALVNARYSIDAAIHSVGDTHAGGALLWGGAELLLVAAMGVMFVQWSNYDRREAARTDRRLDRELAAEGALLAGGTTGSAAEPPVYGRPGKPAGPATGATERT